MMEPGRMRIAITGAEGVVGTVLRRRLAAHHTVVALTREPQPFPSVVANIAELLPLVEAFRGAETVIHLAAAARLDAEWPDILESNIVGTRNVFEAARLAGVSAIVFASSGHVLGLIEEAAGPELYELHDSRVFDETTPLAPDSLYAASKIFGEALGRHYAESYGLRVVCVRLGMVLPDDNPRTEGAGRGRTAILPFAERYPRIRAKWLSHRDCGELFLRCVEATTLRYAIVFGTSNNPRQIWSLDSARRLLNYVPQDAAPAAST